jgi:NADH-quinone oxidoreductase subunit L
MSTIQLALLALAAPAAAATVLALVAPLRNSGRGAIALSLLGISVSLFASFALLWQVAMGAPAAEVVLPWLPGATAQPVAEIGVRVDGVSATMLAAVALVAFCVQLFSVRYLEGEPGKAIGRYFTYQSLFVVSMGILVVAPNLLQLFAGWELVGVTSYLLIGHYFRKPSAARAAVKAFWVTKLADVGLLFALLVVYLETSTFRWDLPMTASAAVAATLLLFLAVAGKSAQFPLHIWLPDAMEGPTPVSALLHAATMVAAGVFLIVRAWPLFVLAPFTGEVMAYVGAFTAVFAAALAVVQSDIKKMLAYSTCSQLGYMVAALGAGSVMGGYFHLLTHAAFKALLFLAAGNLIHAVHSNELGAMGGLGKKMKVTAVTFIVGALALAGVPGLSGAFSKELVLDAVAAKGLWIPYALLMVGVGLTALYMGRAVVRAFFGPPSEAAAHAHEAPLSMLVPVAVLAVPALGAGFLGGGLGRLIGVEYAFHLSPTGIAAMALSLGGLGLAWASTRGGVAAAFSAQLTASIDRVAQGAWVDRAWQAGFYKAFLPVAQLASWFDRYVVDALVNALGAGVLVAGRRLRPIQTGNLRDYLLAVSGAVAVFALWGVFQ